MKIKVLKNERDYDTALKRADQIFDAKPNSAEGEELALLLLVIKDYEDRHHPIAMPDTIEVIKMYMHEYGLKNKDMEGIMGSKSYVSQILNKHKPLTVEMMRNLHKQFGIPASILLAA
jgi:HTH-type transcriptional regulator/antitoxin HigA